MEALCNSGPILVTTWFSSLGDALLSTRVEIQHRPSQAYYLRLIIYSCLQILCYYGEVFQPKDTHQNIPSPEELSISQNPVRMLCRLLGYNFLKGRHSSTGNRVDGKVPSLAGTPKRSRQPFAEAVVHRSGSNALLQLSSSDVVLHHHAI